MVIAVTIVAVKIAAKDGEVPFIIIGKNTNTKQMKLKISAIADFTPFFPPIIQSEIKKIAIKIYIGIERSTLYTVVTCNCPTTLEIVITSNPGLHAVPNNNPLGLFASKICPFCGPVSICNNTTWSPTREPSSCILSFKTSTTVAFSKARPCVFTKVGFST